MVHFPGDAITKSSSRRKKDANGPHVKSLPKTKRTVFFFLIPQIAAGRSLSSYSNRENIFSKGCVIFPVRRGLRKVMPRTEPSSKKGMRHNNVIRVVGLGLDLQKAKREREHSCDIILQKWQIDPSLVSLTFFFFLSFFLELVLSRWAAQHDVVIDGVFMSKSDRESERQKSLLGAASFVMRYK